MKRRQIARGLLLAPMAICLFSCQGGGSTVDPALNPIGLEEGDGTYGIEGNVDNSGGSLTYEIFVRSFADSNGDGIGDFQGIAGKADYLQSLGVGRVWLTPIHPSPSYHGYDVDDYYSVNPEFGTMEDFSSMLETLSEHGIEVIIDMVLNHSSSTNPWFEQSYQDYRNNNQDADSMGDWYMWADSNLGGAYYQHGSAYYLGEFSSSMPDFNWDSQGFRAEVADILGFWLDKGVAGFRLDAVRYYHEENVAQNIADLNYIASICKGIDPDCFIVGENWGNGTDYYDYYASGIDSYFNFNLSIAYSSGTTIVSSAKGLTTGDQFASTVALAEKDVNSSGAGKHNSWFIANHDTDRASKSLTGGDAKAAANLIYLLPGTPFMYYGEEIELRGVRGNEGTDAMRRLPMVWGEGHEAEECDFPDKDNSYLASSVEQVDVGAFDAMEEPLSTINHYRRLAEVRNSYPFIATASFEAIATKTRNFYAYRLKGAGEGEDILVVANLDEVAAEVSLPEEYASWKIDNEVRASNLKARYEGSSLGLGGHSVAILRK